MGQARVLNEGFIGGVKQDQGSVAAGVIHPGFQLFPGGHRSGGVVGEAQVNQIHRFARDLGGKTVATTLTDKIATIGENMTLRRMATLEGETVVSYVHNAAADGMGKIGVLVAMTGGDEAIGKQVAMHIAAVNPAALSEADLDPAIVEKERQVQIDIARESGKPEQVIEKMIDGRMKKFVAESTLLNQQFVVNPDLTVEAAAKEAGATITGFIRVEVGEGIEVEKEDFAAEVAKAAQG